MVAFRAPPVTASAQIGGDVRTGPRFTTVSSPVRRVLERINRRARLRRSPTPDVGTSTQGTPTEEAPTDEGTYGATYFGQDRNPLSRMGLSGYERYARDTSNADIAAYVMWRFFDASTSIDVGCATGFVVEALREVDVDARGCDLSRWAVDNASPGARGHLSVGNLAQRLPYDDGAAQLVSALETLEHLAPGAIPGALAELARVTSAWVIATIPSIGRNDHGPDGFPNSKVLDEALHRYLMLGPGYDGPVPFEDLAVDATGAPIEGHLTIASYQWWTDRFADAGLERCGEMEERIHPVLARFRMTEFWNLYVLRRPGTALPPATVRSPAQIDAVEQRWGLRERRADDRSLEFLRKGLGESAVDAALAEPPT